MKVGIPADFKRGLSAGGPGLEERLKNFQPLTGRALFVGAFLSFFLGAGTNYADIVIRGSYMTLDFSTPGAIFLFLVLVGFLNTLFKVVCLRSWLPWVSALALGGFVFYYYSSSAEQIEPLSPGLHFSIFLVVALLANAVLSLRGGSLALNRSELVVVYIMLVIVASLATMGLCETWLPAIAGVFYYVSPENNWAQILFPHLPNEILVNDGSGNTTLFEGFEQPGQPIPYHLWVRPLSLWAVFLLALYMAMIGLAVILRRQWMDRERLAYPLVQVPQAMIRGESAEGLVNPFFKSKTMWAGAALPILAGLLTGLNKYLAGFPLLTTAWSFPIYGGQSINMTISFAVVGFSYLIGPDIAAGIWGFALLSKLERMVFVSSGVVKTQDVWAVSVSELLNYQGLGALVVFVLLGLWVGREHLKDVWLKCIGRDSPLDDDDEIMSYRAAVLSVFAGGGIMVAWLWALDTPLWAGMLFVAVAMIIFIGITRVVAEAGTAVIISPMIAPDFMIYGLGSKLLGVKAITNFSFTYVFAADIRVFLMAVCANGLKLIEGMDRRSRRYTFWAILIAVFLGVTGSMWAILGLAYQEGGINASSWFFNSMPNIIYQTAVKNLEPKGVYWPGIGFMGGGGAAMLALVWLRQRFLWWPLHPIGFPIMTSWLVDWMWFSIFFAWLVKVLILKYGGADLFSRSRTFFLGLIVGRMLITGFWLVVDFLTGTVGNSIFWV